MEQQHKISVGCGLYLSYPPKIDDEGAVQAAVSKVLASHADAVKQYRAGKKQTYGFLVGQVIKSMGGKANPELVNNLVRRELDKDPA